VSQNQLLHSSSPKRKKGGREREKRNTIEASESFPIPLLITRQAVALGKKRKGREEEKKGADAWTLFLLVTCRCFTSFIQREAEREKEKRGRKKGPPSTHGCQSDPPPLPLFSLPSMLSRTKRRGKGKEGGSRPLSAIVSITGSVREEEEKKGGERGGGDEAAPPAPRQGHLLLLQSPSRLQRGNPGGKKKEKKKGRGGNRVPDAAEKLNNSNHLDRSPASSRGEKAKKKAEEKRGRRPPA